MIAIKNSSVTPESLPTLPNNITVTALSQTHAGIGADRVRVRATIITTGFVFVQSGTATITFPADALSATVFMGKKSLAVRRSAATNHKFFEVTIVAERVRDSTLIEASSARSDSVAV